MAKIAKKKLFLRSRDRFRPSLGKANAVSRVGRIAHVVSTQPFSGRCITDSHAYEMPQWVQNTDSYSLIQVHCSNVSMHRSSKPATLHPPQRFIPLVYTKFDQPIW